MRRLISLLGLGVVGQVALVLTSPPCGSSVHGQAKAEPGRGVARWHDRYGSDLANLAYASRPALPTAMGETLAGCAAVLRPGGLVVLTARPRRRRDLEQALGMVISDRGNPHTASTLAVTDRAQEQHGPRGSAAFPSASATHRPAGHRRAGVLKDQADL